jgi:hypothetical protein
MNPRNRRWIAVVYTLIGIAFFAEGVAEDGAWWACISGLLLLGLAVWICFKS